VIKNIEAGETTATKQDESKATKTTFMQKKNGFIDLDNLPGREKFDRMVRAFYPWPGVWTQLRLSSAGQGKIIKFLPNKMIQVEGKKEMSYKDFINGYPNADPTLIQFLKK
jgi:methionyl-tRNA formyltransferase